jgi:hypothetical protein
MRKTATDAGSVAHLNVPRQDRYSTSTPLALPSDRDRATSTRCPSTGEVVIEERPSWPASQYRSHKQKGTNRFTSSQPRAAAQIARQIANVGNSG